MLTASQREALKLLATAGEGSTVPELVRRGCTDEELHRLVRDGLAKAERMQVRGKPASRAIFHLRISDAGRKALARPGDRPRRTNFSIRLVVLVLFVVGVLAGMCFGALLIAPA